MKVDVLLDQDVLLQLSAGRGHYHSDHYFSTCSVEGIDTGKTRCIAVNMEIPQAPSDKQRSSYKNPRNQSAGSR